MDVLKYQPVIEHTLSKMRVKHGQKQDMIQECYVALLEHKGELTEDIVRSLCRSRAREIIDAEYQMGTAKEKRIHFVSADIPAISKRLARIGMSEEGEISESELYAAIEDLNSEDKQVVRSRFIDGLTQIETAEKLKITRWTVRWRENRGIMALKKYFEVDDAGV